MLVFSPSSYFKTPPYVATAPQLFNRWTNASVWWEFVGSNPGQGHFFALFCSVFGRLKREYDNKQNLTNVDELWGSEILLAIRIEARTEGEKDRHICGHGLLLRKPE